MSTDQTIAYGDGGSDPFSGAGPRRDGKTLGEVCSPLFLFLTAFRRNSATSATSVSELRGRLQELLDAIKESCEDDDRLKKVLPKVWYALVVTADQAILSSSWSERVSWSMDLLETTIFSTAEGGQRFYEMVEETLSTPGDAASEVAEVMFTCMALGFQGELLGDRRRFERRRMALYEKARLPGLGEALTPQAYGRNATKKLVWLPTVGFRRVILVGLVLLLLFVLIGQGLTRFYTHEVRRDIDTVIDDIGD